VTKYSGRKTSENWFFALRKQTSTLNLHRNISFLLNEPAHWLQARRCLTNKNVKFSMTASGLKLVPAEPASQDSVRNRLIVSNDLLNKAEKNSLAVMLLPFSILGFMLLKLTKKLLNKACMCEVCFDFLSQTLVFKNRSI